MIHKKIQRIRYRLSEHRPEPTTLEQPTRAAVTLLLRPQEEDLHVLFIHRAQATWRFLAVGKILKTGIC
jgi:hypothetical protein